MAGNNEFFEALTMLEHERGITAEYLIEKIRAAIVIAVKKNYDVEDENVVVEIDPASGNFNVALVQEVVADEDWENEHTQIPLSKAQTLRRTYQPGDRVITPLKTKEFGRIAAQTAKHVIRQGIREAERSQQLSEIQSKSHDIVMATVTRVDHERGIVAVDMGKGGEAILPRSEQVPGETYTEGQQLQVYIIDLRRHRRGQGHQPGGRHPHQDGGCLPRPQRQPRVGLHRPPRRPCGRCGGAVAAVVEHLHGEKIDIVQWSEDPAAFIASALSPAKVLKVELLPGETRSCRVTVPDGQLSLAIGNKGQNARLCARLTGYNIDIRPESGYYGEEEDKPAEAPAESPAAETAAQPDEAAE